MWKHKNFINLQLYAPPISTTFTIYVNNEMTSLNSTATDTGASTWAEQLELDEANQKIYSITNNVVIWLKNNQILQYNGIDVLGTDAFPDTPNTSTIYYYTTRTAAFDGSISLNKPAGIVLKTQGKYCDKDITITPVLEEKTVTPSTTQQSVEPSDGNVGLKKVTVGAIQIETKTATPSASAQTITPTSGKYLASVTVSAVPSESKTVTPTKSVQTVSPSSGKWLSSVTVNAIPDEYIQPSGTQQIAENGTYDVTDKASVVVDVPSTGGVEEVATSSAMDALLVEANVGKCYKFTGTTDTSYTNGDLYLVEG